MQDKKDTTNSNYAESFPAPVAHSLKRIHQGTGGAAGKAGARNATPNKAQQRESGTQLRTRHSRRLLRLLSFSLFRFRRLVRASCAPCGNSVLVSAWLRTACCASFSVLFRFPPAVPRSPSCSAFPLLCLVLRPVPRPRFSRRASRSLVCLATAQQVRGSSRLGAHLY